MGSLKLAALFLLVAGPAAADDAPKPVVASGYLKELWEYSHSAFNDQPYFLNIDRARLSLDVNESIFKAHIDYDQEVAAGSYFNTAEYQNFGLGTPPTWLTMQQTISTGTTNSWFHRLYRGWVGVADDQGTLRFGRQRIAWGTGKLWNPTDVLNPYQPTVVEPDERTGVDAAYGRYALGDLSSAELAWAPQVAWVNHSLLGRLKTNVKGYDVSAMGGKVADSTSSWMVGGDFAGNLFEGTLHGEWSYTDLVIRTPYWRADLGYDYTFPSDTRLWILRDAAVVAEYFHNGGGVLERSQYDFSQLLSGRTVALAQDYFGFTYSKDLHPLVKLELAVITNMNDGSGFLCPTVQYNIVENLYLKAGYQRFGGGKGTELGRSPNLEFLQAQYFF